MIDDDEIASPDWLERMVSTAKTTGADLVGGPVWPDFDDEMKRGLRRHPAFAPAYQNSGPVPVIYGCGNCLIRRAVFERLGAPAFDLRFNFLGGGDTDFFYRCMRLGLRFHWTADASISETVPQSRTALRLAGDAGPADRRHQLSRPAQGDADAPGRGSSSASNCWRRCRCRSSMPCGRCSPSARRPSPCIRSRWRLAAFWPLLASSRNPTKPRRSHREPVHHHFRSPRRASATSGAAR